MEDPLTLAMRVEQTFADRDLNALSALWADEVEYEAPGVSLRGKAARLVAERVWLDAFPDVTVEIRRQLVGNDWVVFESTMRGTHTGPLKTPEGDIPPTGVSIAEEYATFMWFAGGQVVRQRVYYDRFELLKNLGILPASAEAA